jgi:hypothetical protein
LPVVFTAGFLLGIVHESPLQQHDAPFLALQQAWAFLPLLVFFLQQDMAPLLQQFFMSQQASEFWLVFCGGFRVSPAAEMANTAPQAKLIKSTLIFLIIVTPKSKNCECNSGGNALMTVNILSPQRSCRQTSKLRRHNRADRFDSAPVSAADQSDGSAPHLLVSAKTNRADKPERRYHHLTASEK